MIINLCIVDLLPITFLILGVLIVLCIILYSLVHYIIIKLYSPTYPPAKRGRLPFPPDRDQTLKPRFEWDAQLQVKIWTPDDYHGKNILLLHGWESSIGHFSRQIKFFYDRGFRVIGADLRSSGESEYYQIITQYNWADDISHICHWLYSEYSDISHLTIFGHSLGGVATLTGLGTGQINASWVDRLIIEGIYADGQYILNRFYEDYSIVRLLHPLIVFFMRQKMYQSLPPEHPHHEVLYNHDNLHPKNHVENISSTYNLPLIFIHAEDDPIVSINEFEAFQQLNVNNTFFIRLQGGGHFKTANHDLYFDKLSQYLEKTAKLLKR